MSTDALMEHSHREGQPTLSRKWWQDLRTVRVVRLALAATVAMTIAQLINWPLSFIAPVLVIALMEIPIPAPSLRDFVSLLGYAFLSVTGSFVFVMLAEPYPLIFIAAFTLAIFLVAYLLHKGAPFVLMLLTLIALVLFPVIGNIDEGLTGYVALGLLLSEVVAIIIIQLAHGILPDPPGPAADAMPGFQPGYSGHAARAAAATTITVAPLMAAFLILGWAPYALVLVYASVIALEGTRAHSVYDAKKYLTANAIGGASALIFYLVIVTAPEVHVFVLTTLLVTLLFAQRRFSDAADAKFYGSALIGVIILISTSVGAGADIDVNIVKRILFIVLASIYVIGVMSLIEPASDSGEEPHPH